jgi:predicted AAA+ superfamily ATPase
MAAPDDLLPRHAAPLVETALADFPVVLLHGPRQSGKTTLARIVAARRGMAWHSLDDPATREAATGDPVGFARSLEKGAVLDEVQRAPGLFVALKATVDEDRRPGRFLLAGSANILALPRLSDSLAGRMAIVRLHPLSQAEIERRPAAFLPRLFRGEFPTQTVPRDAGDLIRRIVRGGYPATRRAGSGPRAAAWLRDYLRTVLERDAAEVSRLRHAAILPRLLEATAAVTATPFNFASLARPFGVARATIQDYASVLERLFLLHSLPAWHGNRLRRLTRAPKLHLADSGLAAAVLGLGEEDLEADRTRLGALAESFVHGELRRLADAEEDPPRLTHFRDRDGAEVDIVLERGVRSVAGVEVKTGETVRGSDFSGLRKLRAATGRRFTSGVVLYDGTATLPFGERLFAVPVRALWGEA